MAMAARRRPVALLVALGAAVVVVVALVLVTTLGAGRTNPIAAEQAAVASGGPLPVGAELPAGQMCANLIRHPGDRETRPSNTAANTTTPARVVIPPWGDGYDPRMTTAVLSRIDGNFTGTTDEILAWGACKWGLDADVIRAMAMEESEWQQSLTGDFSDDQADCVPGDVAPCPTSFGILQVKHLYRPGSYPDAREHTAFNVDYALGVVRACVDGDITYLRPKGYGPGDMWGCLGWHYSGEWRNAEALGYVSRVQGRLADRGWERW